MEWIKVEDELPEFGKEVLVLGEKMGMNPSMGGAYHCLSRRIDVSKIKVNMGIRNHWDDNGFSHMRYVTYWMPLPKKP